MGYGIGHIDGSGVWRWQLMFLILGAVTSGYGLVLVAALPDSPAKAVFLSERERAIAVQRTLKNKTGVLDAGSFRWDQAFQALRDPQTWLLVLYTVSMNLANGVLQRLVFWQGNAQLTTTVSVDPHRWIRVLDVRITSPPDARRRDRDNLPGPRVRGVYLRTVDTDHHDGIQHGLFDGRDDSDVEIRSDAESGQTVCTGAFVGVCDQHS